MNIYEPNDPADPVEIEKIERELGVRLPQEYRAFLARYNGGYPEPDSFLFHSRYPGNFFGNGINGNRAMVDRFLGLYEGEHNNLRSYLQVYLGRIPSTMIPIAGDPGGNLICLAVKGEDAGKVFFWQHEEEAEEGEIADYRNIYFVADRFDDFFLSLVE